MKKSFFFLLSVLLIINSCESDEPEMVNCSESGLSLVLGSVGGASGCNTLDGSIQVAVTGGKEPYRFSLDDVTFQATGDFTNVNAGIYTVSVTDANGCQAFVNNVNVTTEGFSISAGTKSDSLCLEAGNGTITITATGDNEPFSYRLGDGDYSENSTFTGLNEGNHKITVKDNTNCTVALTVTVPHGFSGTSWSNEVLPIVETECALSGCHNGVSRPDLRLYEKASFYARYMKELTQNGTMPFDGTLTREQIDIIACWVDDGALNN